MKAEIISVGTELLLGEITDTNARFLAGELPGLGIDLYWVSQVGDNQRRLVEVLRRAWQRSDLILISGGLGPTEDDLTREAIAELLGEEPQVIPALEAELRQFFTRLGREMSPTNLKQATLIPSARTIPNTNGTAPGWRVEKEGHVLIAMPGPPREIQPMWQKEILPRLRQQTGGAILVTKTLKSFGLPEADVAEMVSSLVASANPTLGIYAKADGIHLRLAAKALSQQPAEQMIAQTESKLRSLLGENIWGVNDETLEGVIGGMLSRRGLTLAIMESYRGGLLAATITDAPGATAYFKGGLVTESDEALITFGVGTKLISDYGSSSAEVAQAMAEAVRLRLGANLGIGTTGTSEPDEIDGKSVNQIHIGIADDRTTRIITTGYPGNRARGKRWAVAAALSSLRKTLITHG